MAYKCFTYLLTYVLTYLYIIFIFTRHNGTNAKKKEKGNNLTKQKKVHNVTVH